MGTEAHTRSGTTDWAGQVARVATWLLVAQLALSGVVMLARPPMIVTMIGHLGYPEYFPMLLGAAKLLGALAIGHARYPTLTEWAYAGATFDVLAAAASHAAVGDALGETLSPLVAGVLIAVSYRQPRDRKDHA